MGDIMKDKRIRELAYKLLTYYCNLQKGEKVYISAKGLESLDLVKELVKQTIDLGGVPFFYYEDHSIMRNLLMNVSEEQMKAFTAIHKPIMEAVDCFIGIRAPDNMFDLSDIPHNPFFLRYNNYHFVLPKLYSCYRWYHNRELYFQCFFLLLN